MKKSKSGIATPRPDKQLVESRLLRAKAHHAATYRKKKMGS